MKTYCLILYCLVIAGGAFPARMTVAQQAQNLGFTAEQWNKPYREPEKYSGKRFYHEFSNLHEVLLVPDPLIKTRRQIYSRIYYQGLFIIRIRSSYLAIPEDPVLFDTMHSLLAYFYSDEVIKEPHHFNSHEEYQNPGLQKAYEALLSKGNATLPTRSAFLMSTFQCDLEIGCYESNKSHDPWSKDSTDYEPARDVIWSIRGETTVSVNGQAFDTLIIQESNKRHWYAPDLKLILRTEEWLQETEEWQLIWKITALERDS